MWARVATFRGGDSERMRAEVERRLQRPDGFAEEMKGLLVLEDREAGQRVFVALFETHDEMIHAEPALNRMREEIPEDVRGQRLSLEYYEVVAQQLP